MLKVIGHATQNIKASLGPRQATQSPTVALRSSWEGPFCSKVRFPWILADQDMIGPPWNLFKVIGHPTQNIKASQEYFMKLLTITLAKKGLKMVL